MEADVVINLIYSNLNVFLYQVLTLMKSYFY